MTILQDRESGSGSLGRLRQGLRFPVLEPRPGELYVHEEDAVAHAESEVERSRVVPGERDPERQFQMVMAVFREYLLDLEHDIEGCDGDDLQDIESQIEATQRLRRRVVAHVCEGRDARGQ